MFTESEREQIVNALIAQRALEHLRDTRPGWADKAPHDKGQLQALQSDQMIRVLIPGNGWGKSQRVDTEVLTPNGFGRIGDLKVGDQVIGGDGKPTKVAGVYPQPIRDFYRLTFHDGTQAECCGDHLWTVQMRENRFLRSPGDPRYGQWQTLALRDILERIGPEPTPTNKPAIPMVGPVQFPRRETPVDPYILGVWLADGSPSGQITTHGDDDDIRVAVGGNDNTDHTNANRLTFTVPGLVGGLRKLGLAGCRCWEKAVPEDYLWNDEETRRAILAGLMDSDGSSMGNKDEFSTTSEQLADDVVFLTQSLGGRAVKSGPRRTSYTHGGERRLGRPSWRVRLTLPECPYRSVRKRESWRPRETRINRLITGIERIADSDGVCIKVAAADGLYVIHDFIVTHNTTCMALDADFLMQRDDPYKPHVIPRHNPTAIWFCMKYQQWEVMQPDVEEVLTRGWVWHSQKHYYSWPNGSRMFVLSTDSDWTAIQGVQPDAVYFDEHPDRKFWNEMMFRRRGRAKTRFMVAATMTQGITWFTKSVIQAWESLCRELGLTGSEAVKEQPHPKIFCWPSGGVLDNPAMTEADAEHYATAGEMSDAEREVRTKGGYADFTGTTVFDRDAIKRLREGQQEGESGAIIFVPDEDDDMKERIVRAAGGSPIGHRFAGVVDREFFRWVPEMQVQGGRITIFEPPDPEQFGNYVIGADFAAGLVGKDYDAAMVGLRTADGPCVQVAQAHGHWGDIFFAEVLYMLGVLYGEAFICGERQFGLPCLRRLYDEMGYTYLYAMRREQSRSRRPSDALGHHRAAGDTIIPNHQLAIRRGDTVIVAEDAVTEHAHYQYKPRRKDDLLDDIERSADLVTGAPSGEFDDLVMAGAYMTHAAREVGRFERPKRTYRRGTFGEVMKLDQTLKPGRPRRDPYAIR